MAYLVKHIYTQQSHVHIYLYNTKVFKKLRHLRSYIRINPNNPNNLWWLQLRIVPGDNEEGDQTAVNGVKPLLGLIICDITYVCIRSW